MSFDPSSQYCQYNQGVQQPVFASSNANQQQPFGDDFDLNEIFADYFLDDVGAGQNAAARTSAANLPTGRGIQTAYHSTAGGEGVAWKKQKFAHLSNGIQSTGGGTGTATNGGMTQSSIGGGPPKSSSTLTGRLGFQLHTQQHTAQTAYNPRAAAAAAAKNMAGGVKPQHPAGLPVGVGIRVPGAMPNVAGVPSTTGVGGIQHNQWGRGGITLPPQAQMWQHAHGGVDLSKPVSSAQEQAVAERRQRNREHAKRSRVRKKFMLESLQEQVRALQRDNTSLRMIVQDRLPTVAQKIFDECCVTSHLFKDNHAPSVEGLGGKNEETLMKSDFNLIQSLASGQQNFVLSDPRLPDNPIVYASAGFYNLTGYSREQVLGRNCRFLQGPGTDPKDIEMIRSAVAKGNDFSICVLNYKADGTPFWNQLFVAALRDTDNCIVNFIGVQCAVETEGESTLLEDKVNSVLPLALKDDPSPLGLSKPPL